MSGVAAITAGWGIRAADETCALMLTEALTLARIVSTFGRLGESEQTGSVAAGSPANNKAWQRQPPKSMERRSQDLQGSCIQSWPRNFWNAAEFSQISRRLCCFTLLNCRPGIIFAAWQGNTSPFGVISMSLR